jgi:ABC-type phosphate/phosphonate transport system substrate-binding protein
MTHHRLILILCLCAALAVVGCRRQNNAGGLVSQPTLTPTPRSTPLPSVPTAVPVGNANNPLQMAIYPEGNTRDAQNAVSDIEDAIKEQSGLVVKIQLVERYAEALAALCGSATGTAAVAWLNGPAYMAAQAQNCGNPVLQVERESGGDAKSGEAAAIIAAKGKGVNNVPSLKGKTFCRLNNGDFYSWLAPSLMMRASQLNPVTDLKAVVDKSDIPTLIKAVASGDCNAGGIPANALNEFADQLGDAKDKTAVVANSIDFPYPVLVMPLEVPLGTRLSLTKTLTDLAEDKDNARQLRALLGQETLRPVTAEDFKDLATFMQSTGLDFAQLGS